MEATKSRATEAGEDANIALFDLNFEKCKQCQYSASKTNQLFISREVP